MSVHQRVTVHRAAARLAGRELRRRPWRTALVVLLVALPVAAMVLAAGILRTGKPPFDLEDRSNFGLADAMVAERDGRTAQSEETLEQARARVLAAAPGARMAVGEAASGSVQGPVGEARFVILATASNDPILMPRTTLRTGRLPRGRDEVAISPQLARAWRLDVGGRLDLAQLDIRAKVVGIAHPLTGARSDTLYVGEMPDLAPDQRGRSLYIDLPGDTEAVVTTLRAIAAGSYVGMPARHAAAVYGATPGYDQSDRDAEVRWSTVIGALALAVLGIVIAAAFAVGARRQLRTLGILASNGASPAALRAVVLWQGAWTGLLGSAAGLALGAVGLAAAWPHHDRFLPYEPGWFTLRLSDLAPIAFLGVATALVASYQPARSVSRLSILTSLAGRRPLAPVRRRVVLAGVAAMATGTGFLAVATVGGEGRSEGSSSGSMNLWAAIAVLGGLGLLFGSSAVAPALVGVFDPLAKRFRGSPHLALRSLGRQRARTGAVVAAVCAAAALAVAASAVLVSATDQSEKYFPANLVLFQQHTFVEPETPLPPPPPLRPGQTFSTRGPIHRPGTVAAEDVARAAAIIPGSHLREVAYPYGFLVATPAVLDTFEVDARTRRLLAEHGAVRPGGGERQHGQIASFGRSPGSSSEAVEAELLSQVEALSAGSVAAPASPYGFVNGATLVSVDRAAQSRISTADPGIALVSPRPLTRAQRAALDDFQNDRQNLLLRLASAPAPAPDRARAAELSSLQVSFHRPPPVSPLVVYAILDGIALLFTGFVIVVGLALAAAETREEVEVLTAVGASPSTLRRLAATKTALLSGAGVALAVPTGLIPVWVVRNASSGSGRFVVPWASLGLLVLVLPALLALLTLAGSTLLARLRPITASTMVTD